MSSFEFTTTDKPEKVVRLELELVDFSIILTTQNGNCITLRDQTKVQSTLNQARDFNEKLGIEGNERIGNEAKVEIKLDPVNSVNTYVIPA